MTIKRCSAFPNLQHYWSLCIRLFWVICRTLVEGVVPLFRDASALSNWAKLLKDCTEGLYRLFWTNLGSSNHRTSFSSYKTNKTYRTLLRKIETNSYALFSSGPPHMYAPVLTNQQKPTSISFLWTKDIIKIIYQERWSIWMDSKREYRESLGLLVGCFF